jgi:hypothetical protein
VLGHVDANRVVDAVQTEVVRAPDAQTAAGRGLQRVAHRLAEGATVSVPAVEVQRIDAI